MLTKNSAGVQLKLVLPLGTQRHQAGVVRARADLAEPDRVALDEQLNAKQPQPGGLAVTALAQVVGHDFGNLAAFFQRGRLHRMRLPAFHIIAADLLARAL